MKTTQPPTIHLKDYEVSNYLIDQVELDVSLHPERTHVTSKLKIRPNPAYTGRDKKLVLDGENLELVSIKQGGKKLAPKDYILRKTGLTLKKPPTRAFTLEIKTYCNPQANKALSGLYRSSNIYCTQCEAQGFRNITYFLDRPDILATYTTRIEAPRKEAPVLLSNGNLIKKGKVEGTDRHFTIWHDPHPKPAYLFALVGGKLGKVSDQFVTRSGRKVKLEIFVEPGKEDRCDWAMDSLKRSMKWDEKRFGCEYDLDIFMIVAVSDFNMGAMENKGLNIFNDKLILARPETATDADYEAIESVIAHEYFHNWTGNRVTCRDWFQLCLKEGLTVFRDQEFSADMRDATVQRIQDVRVLRTHQFPEDNGPLAHPVRPSSYIEINNFYTSTVYQKGAELCHMIQTMVGRAGFRKGTDLYFERHDGEAATVEDFIAAMEDANEIDLSQFMIWYRQAGTPELICSLDYDKKNKAATLTVNQLCKPTPGEKKKDPRHIPLKIGLLDGQGNDIALDDKNITKDGVLHIRKKAEKFTFKNIAARPVPSLLRGFSAPVKLNINLDEKDRVFLMMHDDDLFNRWQSAQNYMTEILIDRVEALQRKKRSSRGRHLIASLEHVLKDESLAPAYRAEFLKLPSEADLAREIGKNLDPSAIHRARKSLLRKISKDLSPLLDEIYQRFENKGRYSPTATPAGKRSLRNVALAIRAASEEQDAIDMVIRHYRKAKNMTDQMAALAVLSQSAHGARHDILEEFYTQWQDDHLVLDKWFSLQAISPQPDCLDKVKDLMSHEKFSLKNPNKVRALIGAFAQANLVNFNRADGEGYAFVAQTALEIDGFNPQIAARLFGVFRSWRLLEPKRRGFAQNALREALANSKLSKDSYEIISKTLE